MQVRFSFFLKELVLFVLAMGAGIFVAYQYSFSTPDTIIVQPLQFSWWNLALIIVMFLVLSFVLSRFRRVAGFTFRLFLILVVFSGAQLVFGSFLLPPWDLALALLLVLMHLFIPNAFSHNLAMIVGIAGVAALLGLSITPLTALAVVATLSVYDIVAVYKTRHMVKLAQNMIRSNAIFGFLIPIEGKHFLANLRGRPIQDRFMILGSGDIGVPIMLAASFVTTSLNGAYSIAAGACVGLFVTHLLFVNQTQRRAMAALPPIATGSILGFLIALAF